MNAFEFKDMIHIYEGSLMPAALKLTRDTDEANDLIQDTLVKAISNKDKFKEGTNLRAWLYTIMKNTFITNYHRLVKRKTFVDTTDNLFFINSTDQITENLAPSQLSLSEIHRAIDSLNPDYKTPFMMYFQGYKYHEIADILAIPIGTVKNRIHITRKELKQKLMPYKK